MPRFEHRNGLLPLPLPLPLLLDGIPFLFSSSSSKIELPRHLDAQIAWYNAGILPFPMPDISTWPKRIDPRILDRDTELEPVASIYMPDISKNLFRVVTSVSSIRRAVVRITCINKNSNSCKIQSFHQHNIYNNCNVKILNPLFYGINEIHVILKLISTYNISNFSWQFFYSFQYSSDQNNIFLQFLILSFLFVNYLGLYLYIICRIELSRISSKE